MKNLKYLKSGEFWEAALLRAIWTLAESFLALEAASRTIAEVDYRASIAAAFGAAILSLCKSIVVGVPEAPEEE